MLDPNKKYVGKQVYLRPITDSEEDTNNIIHWRNSEAVRPYFIYCAVWPGWCGVF